jgi:hypothetical protein
MSDVEIAELGRQLIKEKKYGTALKMYEEAMVCKN